MSPQFSLLALGHDSIARVPLCIRNGIFALGCWDKTAALDLLRADSYEVLICDLQLADTDAAGFVRMVREVSPHTSIVFSIDPGDLHHALSATLAGASGYVIRGDCPHSFLHDIKKARARKMLMAYMERVTHRRYKN